LDDFISAMVSLKSELHSYPEMQLCFLFCCCCHGPWLLLSRLCCYPLPSLFSWTGVAVVSLMTCSIYSKVGTTAESTQNQYLIKKLQWL